MKLINAMESIVIATFKEFSKDYTVKCNCEKCQSDILAITLNTMKPKYVSSEQGEVLVKALYSDVQLQYDIVRELTLATIQVETKPRH